MVVDKLVVAVVLVVIELAPLQYQHQIQLQYKLVPVELTLLPATQQEITALHHTLEHL